MGELGESFQRRYSPTALDRSLELCLLYHPATSSDSTEDMTGQCTSHPHCHQMVQAILVPLSPTSAHSLRIHAVIGFLSLDYIKLSDEIKGAILQMGIVHIAYFHFPFTFNALSHTCMLPKNPWFLTTDLCSERYLNLWSTLSMWVISLKSMGMSWIRTMFLKKRGFWDWEHAESTPSYPWLQGFVCLCAVEESIGLLHCKQ